MRLTGNGHKVEDAVQQRVKRSVAGTYSKPT